jgi:hypothetical protein
MKKIPPFELILKPMNEKAKKIKLPGKDSEAGNRFKLGGEPDLIQAKQNPICSGCKQEMSFYAQLDSINDDYMIAENGMIYVYYCFDCFEVKALVQSN